MDAAYLKKLWAEGEKNKSNEVNDFISKLDPILSKFKEGSWKRLFDIGSSPTDAMKEDLNRFLRKESRIIFGDGNLSFHSYTELKDEVLESCFTCTADNVNEINDNSYVYNKILVLRSLLDDQRKLKCHFVFISDETLDKVFEAFSVLDKDTANKIKNFPNWAQKSRFIIDVCYNNLRIDRNKENDVRIYKYIIEPLTYGANPVLTNDFSLFPNIILYGAPGTGKTYQVMNAMQILAADGEHFKMVQCHPGFGYEEFIEGLKPIGINDTTHTLEFKVVNGVFKQLCIKAKERPNEAFYFIADEINRANLSAMFGETLSLLEKNYRCNPESFKTGNKPDDKDKANLRQTPLSQLLTSIINKENDKKDNSTKDDQFYVDDNNEVYFGIPSNVYFIGMMNDVDKSIDSFDLALRRRFKWIRCDCDYDVIKNSLLSQGIDDSYVSKYVDACKRLNSFISGDNWNDGTSLEYGKAYEFGHDYYMKVGSNNGKILKTQYDNLFDNHIDPVLREYIRSFVSEKEVETEIKRAKKDVFICYAPENMTPEKFEEAINNGLKDYMLGVLNVKKYIENCVAANNRITKELGEAYRLSSNVLIKIFKDACGNKKSISQDVINNLNKNTKVNNTLKNWLCCEKTFRDEIIELLFKV